MRLEKNDLLELDYIDLINFEKFSNFKGISTDSRNVKKNNIFIAIKGEKFDGHTFVFDTFKKGAAFAIVEENWFKNNTNNDYSFIIVKDTLKAFGQLANIYRRKFHNPILAVAGSNGKTTTKDMIAAVLSKKFKVLKTEGNLNNQIGVPSMLFKLNDKIDFAILEIGTNHFGEIKYLCDIVEPDLGILTNIGKEHLEFFKNIDGVKKEEGSLFVYLRKNERIAFVNNDDPLISDLSKELSEKIVFGFNGKTNYKGIQTKQNEFKIKYGKNEIDIQLNILGKHNFNNAFAAATVGLAFGVKPKEIQNALKNFKPSSKRMELKNYNGIKIINDCYNSNPDSVKAALETLNSIYCKGNKIVILGDMLELGKSKVKEHKEVGKLIKSFDFDSILLYGELSRNTYNDLRNFEKFIKHYSDKDELTNDLIKLLNKNDIILLKGSRGMKMETILNNLTEYPKSKEIV